LETSKLKLETQVADFDRHKAQEIKDIKDKIVLKKLNKSRILIMYLIGLKKFKGSHLSKIAMEVEKLKREKVVIIFY
jgi:hypothetical protein